MVVPMAPVDDQCTRRLSFSYVEFFTGIGLGRHGRLMLEPGAVAFKHVSTYHG